MLQNESSQTTGMVMKQKFFDEENILPNCVNDGCNRNVAVRYWSTWAFKTECSTCQQARVTGKMGLAMSGVTIHKKTYCENTDGHLGWFCPVDIDAFVELGMLNALDLEHTDGDHGNNVHSNVKTICKLCHGKKSIQFGDCSNQKPSARKLAIRSIN